MLLCPICGNPYKWEDSGKCPRCKEDINQYYTVNRSKSPDEHLGAREKEDYWHRIKDAITGRKD